jgi:hypothetical protein
MMPRIFQNAVGVDLRGANSELENLCEMAKASSGLEQSISCITLSRSCAEELKTLQLNARAVHGEYEKTDSGR